MKYKFKDSQGIEYTAEIDKEYGMPKIRKVGDNEDMSYHAHIGSPLSTYGRMVVFNPHGNDFECAIRSSDFGDMQIHERVEVKLTKQQ